MILIILFSNLLFADSPSGCQQILWGEIHYTDLNAKEQIVKKTEIFPIEEWSAHSQFDYLLIEKNKSLLQKKKINLRISLAAKDKKKSSVRQIETTANTWRKNNFFFLVDKFDPRKVLGDHKKRWSEMTVQILANKKVLCTERISIHHGH